MLIRKLVTQEMEKLRSQTQDEMMRPLRGRQQPKATATLELKGQREEVVSSEHRSWGQTERARTKERVFPPQELEPQRAFGWEELETHKKSCHGKQRNRGQYPSLSPPPTHQSSAIIFLWPNLPKRLQAKEMMGGGVGWEQSTGNWPTIV